MFWACSISGSRGFDLVHSAKFGEVLHLSHIVLHNTEAGVEKTTVYLRLGKKKCPLAYLSSKAPMARVDIYVSTQERGSLIAEGKGKLSVFGYFEPELQSGKRRKIEELDELEEANSEENEKLEGNSEAYEELESEDDQRLARTQAKVDDEDSENQSSEEIERSEEVEEESSESVKIPKKKR